jgi:hypothetical protein
MRPLDELIFVVSASPAGASYSWDLLTSRRYPAAMHRLKGFTYA